MKAEREAKVGRRDFLRTLGLGAGLAAVAAAPLAQEAGAAESEQEAKKPRYDADSEHVKDYYRVNRY